MIEMKVHSLVCVGLLALGCSADAEGANENGTPTSVEIPHQPLSGKIGGESWTFTSARTDAFLGR